jgi:hypothetical protein
MVVEAALRGVPVDTARLFDDPGPYALWIESVLEGVREAHDQIARS